jgi:hypothetical protein
MSHNETEYEKLLRGLALQEKSKLQQLREKNIEIEEAIIKRNIENDRNHLQIVNFSINPFYQQSFLHRETGYIFVRVEPFYGLQLKDFDSAIYNKDSKVLILVECKSSVSDAESELEDILKKIEIAEENHKKLEDIIGAEIAAKEYVLCSDASIIHKFEPAVIKRDSPLCLWSAELARGRLFLKKLKDDVKSEMKSGRLHTDQKLTQLLLDIVTLETKSVPVVAFLPSSHPCAILTEVCSLLQYHLEKVSTQTERFRLLDIQRILEGERGLSNLDSNEVLTLAEKIVGWSKEINIFKDETPTISDEFKKEYSMQRRSIRTISREIPQKYVQIKAKKKAEKKAVDELRKEIPTIERFLK